jgi:hypothetical protein
MIPVLIKSVWLRNICFSKVATTLFKFIKVGNTRISQDSGKYWEIRLILNLQMVQETSKLIFMFCMYGQNCIYKIFNGYKYNYIGLRSKKNICVFTVTCQIESKEGRKTVTRHKTNFENEIPESDSGTTISGFADSYEKKKKIIADRPTLDFFDM